MKAKTEIKHTPGPWWFDGREVMTVPLGEIKVCRIHPVSQYDDGSANAKLIAAAPDLLDACESVIRLHQLIRYDEPVKPEHEGEATTISAMLLKVQLAVKKAKTIK